jgi:signal transduction histidine kinase
METVGQLAGGIAHDFNNLLTAITGRTEFLADGQNLEASQREDVEEIRLAAERAAALTRQLLAFSRKQLLTPRVIDLNEVIRGMEPMLRRLIGEDIVVQIVGEQDLGHITADKGQVEQVLLNLCLNARDAMAGRGKLTIETANLHVEDADATAHPGVGPGDYVAILVSDTGIGMPQEVRDKAFDPFFTTKEAGKGTGLGLSQVNGFVTRSGGHCTIRSEPGHGTTIKLYLPRYFGGPQGGAAEAGNAGAADGASADGHGDTPSPVARDAAG